MGDTSKFIQGIEGIVLVESSGTTYTRAMDAISNSTTISELRNNWPLRAFLDEEEKQNFSETFVKLWLFRGGSHKALGTFLDAS
jgi:hypothetical protein